MSIIDSMKYYTLWGFVAFIIVLILIPFNILPTWIIQAIIVNEIAIGLGGNILAAISIDSVLQKFKESNPEAEEKDLVELGRKLTLSNMYFHTLPLILALLVYPYYRGCEDGSCIKSFTFVLVFFLIWLCVPHEDNVLINKVKHVYLEPPLWLMVLLPITWFALLY